MAYHALDADPATLEKTGNLASAGKPYDLLILTGIYRSRPSAATDYYSSSLNSALVTIPTTWPKLPLSKLWHQFLKINKS